MADFIKELKKDGLLLKTIPSKERTAEQCLIAVRQNPRAIKYVPCKLQTEKLCKAALKKDPSVFKLIYYKAFNDKVRLYLVKQDGMLLKEIPEYDRTKAICRAALFNTIRALRYVPKEVKDEIYPNASDEFVMCCMEWLHDDIMALNYLPTSVINSRLFMNKQKERGCLTVTDSMYDRNTHSFQVGIKYTLQDENNKAVTRSGTASFSDFGEYYDFLDGNLEGALLRGFDFDGIDLHDINISGAVIHNDVLVRQGLYDSSYYDARFGNNHVQSMIEKNELVLTEPIHYLMPAEDEGFTILNVSNFTIFYVSDIHLKHRIKHVMPQRGTKEEVHAFIRLLVHNMVRTTGSASYNSFLLIAGDVSDWFEFTEVFYRELVKLWIPSKIVVISGNHELLDPDETIENNIAAQREFFKSLGIIFLHNDLFCACEPFRNHPLVVNEEQLLTMSEDLLCEKVCQYPFLVLGGIGFSGLNKKYNATNMPYGRSFYTLPNDDAKKKREMAESSRFAALHQKLSEVLSKKSVIVLTHMRKEDWTDQPYVPGWSYVSGHNHRNCFEVNDQKRVYADNQIGYHRETVGLKYFYINGEYDTFFHYNDGIYQITLAQYEAFNRGKGIISSCNRTGINITMLKKNGYYMFLYYGKYSGLSKYENMYLLTHTSHMEKWVKHCKIKGLAA